MKISASAPGKMLLLGEYAVLEGAPAIVMAVSRRATVNVTPISGSYSRLQAVEVGVEDAEFCWKDGALTWHRPTSLPLFEAIVAVHAKAYPGLLSLPPLSWQLSTRDFYDPQRACKLGFGSSAALCVATTAAIQTLSDVAVTPSQCFPLALDAHRSFQGGLGSGADIAAACRGGLILYRQNGEWQPALDWPSDLYAACVWTGRSATTSDFLNALTIWSQQAPRAYRRHLDTLGRHAEQGAQALMTADTCAFLSATSAFVAQLERVATRAGLAIVTAVHRQLMTLGDRLGVLYKTAGAGGGDLGLAMTQDQAALQGFARAVRDLGYPVWMERVASTGVRITTTA